MVFLPLFLSSCRFLFMHRVLTSRDGLDGVSLELASYLRPGPIYFLTCSNTSIYSLSLVAKLVSVA
jgi:hypothetical protein